MRLEDFKVGDQVVDLCSDDEATCFFEIERILDRPTPIETKPLSRLYMDAPTICFSPERLRLVTDKERNDLCREPIEVLNWGSDRYMLVAFGWHNIERFKDACRAEYDSFMYSLDSKTNPAPVEHCYYCPVPDSEIPDGHTSYYEPCSKETEGAVPLTIWNE